jgi:hypothetical protein
MSAMSLDVTAVIAPQHEHVKGLLDSSVANHAVAEKTDEWPALWRITDPAIIDAMIEQMQAVPVLAEDPSAPGVNATITEMQEWAKSRLPRRAAA